LTTRAGALRELPPTQSFTMVKSITKVIYKPDSQSSDEYICVVNPSELKKWKEGDTTIPLTAVVDSFQVFFSNQGNQGLLGKASKQQLENTFGTSVDVEVIKFMLKNGREQAGDALSNGSANTNLGKGSLIDNKGRGTSGVGSKH